MKKTILVITLLFSFLATQGFSQITRKVLFEEATNASCAPCAANNPILKAFLDAHPEIIAIKYHSSWPGYDPMYNYNPTQNTERIVSYYGINAVPWLNVDGIINDVWPFTVQNFTNALNTRMGVTPPLDVTVTDQRIAGDSIRATVTIQIPASLPSGNYKLRVFALERWIVYQNPPGSNGEMIFEHVFRKAFPNTAGTTIQTTAGTYQHVFKYKRESVWNDTSVYTVAFVQNDNNKEVLNSNKGSYNTTGIISKGEIPSVYSLSQNYPNPFNPVTNINFSIPKNSKVSLKVYDVLGNEVAVLFEGFLNAGSYTIRADASSWASGVYAYRITADGFTSTRKMMVVR